MAIFIGIGTSVGIIASVLCVIFFLQVQRREDQGWSLASAMSEVIGYDREGNARYVSSSSRFIALVGFILIFWIYAGVGVTILVNGGVTPSDLTGIEKYMFFGLAMFAPYIANQARAALVGIGKGVPVDLAPRPANTQPPEGGKRDAAAPGRD